MKVERKGQEVLSDPGSKGTCERAAAERRLIQKVRSYHHPEDTGACLLPSDINPGGWGVTDMIGLTVSPTHLPLNKQSSNSRYPFLHLQLRSVSVAFLPLKGQQRQSEMCPNHSGGGRGGGGGRHSIHTCVAFSSWSFRSASSRSVSRNWAFSFSFSARICS